MTSEPGARARFETKVQMLVGRRIRTVDYWDIHQFGPEPARWDYGDWHHAVMGVQLSTDAGPVTVTWTNAFHPYGVEVFDVSIGHHLVLGEGGPERIGPDDDSRWASFLDKPVLKAMTWWDRLEPGPATWLSKGEVVEPARAVDVPTAIRLDFDAGPVWFVAAMPEAPSMEDVFITGDEIVVVFAAEKIREMGYDDLSFTS